MNKILLIGLLAILFTLLEGQARSKLLFVQQVFRHGARYPIYPNQADNSYYAVQEHETGELTRQGKKMHYLLGLTLFQTYWDALFQNTPFNRTYSPTKMYIRSTDVNRTIESVQSQLQGILENLPKLSIFQNETNYSSPPWSNPINAFTGDIYINAPYYHPTAVHVQKGPITPFDKGDFLRTYSPEICPNQDKWAQFNINTERAQQIMADPGYVAALQALSKALNKSVSFIQSYKYLDNYECMKHMSRWDILPIYSQTETLRALESIYTLDMYLKLFHSQVQLAATATGYFNATIQNIKTIMANPNAAQWILYSAHDTTVGNFLAALNMTNVECIYDAYLRKLTKNTDTCVWIYPTYASSLIFEVFKYTNGTHTIKIRYNGGFRKIPFCNWALECRVEELFTWYDSWKDEKYDLTCGIKDTTSETYFSVAAFEFILILSMLLIYLIGYLKRKAVPHSPPQAKFEESLLSSQ